MTDPDPDPDLKPDAAPKSRTIPRQLHPLRLLVGKVVMLSLLLAVLGLGLMALTGRSISVPAWVVTRLETRVNTALGGQGRLEVGGVDLLVDADWVPNVRLRDVVVANQRGEPVLSLPDLRLSLAKSALLERRLQLQSLRISGASLTLRRGEDGTIRLDMANRQPAAATPLPIRAIGPGSLPDVLGAIDRAFALPALAGIETIEADGLTVTLDDARAGRVWRATEGRMTLLQTPSEISINVDVAMPGAGAAAAGVSVAFSMIKGTRVASLVASITDLASGDIATQSAALAWMGLLDAPISGTLRADVAKDGHLGPLNGTLEIGAGQLRPGDVGAPVELKGGRVAFAYDPDLARVDFSEVALDSRALRIRASGHAYLVDLQAGLPQTLVAQVELSDVAVDPEGLFEAPVRFTQGALDLRLRLEPFSLSIGQLVLIEDARRIEARGEIGATSAGWQVSLDMALNEIAHDRLLALWPVGLVPLTRAWLVENVQTGLLFDVNAALRLQPGTEPRLSLGYEFSNADVRFLKTLPPITESTGYSTIEGNQFTLVIDKGVVTAAKGGRIDVAGSVFRVPDITVKPPPATISLRTDSTITAALSLLDEPPFGFLTKAEQPVDLAEGRAKMVAEIGLTLTQKVLPGDVNYRVQGQLLNVRTDIAVPGRLIEAAEMALQADPQGMQIAGPGTIDGVPFTATYSQGFGAEALGKARIEGSVELSQLFVDAFRIGLPKGTVTGNGLGRIVIEMARGTAAQFSLTSTLAGVGLKIPALGWSKSRNATGRLEVAGRLGTPPAVDRLSLDVAGLKAAGRVVLKADGGLDRAVFSRVRVGGWLDSPVTLTGQGGTRPVAVAVTGGSIDLRRSTFGGSGGGESGPMAVQLQRLVISEGIALTDFRGRFTGRGGFNGSFTGLVNGQSPISGTVAPKGDRSAFRLQSQNAGDVFRAAGVFDRGRGGLMDLILTPTGTSGNYRGRLTISDARVRQAPALAELLSAISVIGLLQQLNGDGIVFDSVESDFLLTPTAIEVSQGSAIGPSMGVTMAGLYQLGSKQMRMQGVISPIYLLNGIGEIFTRRGEGLFGFNYRLNGTPSDPQVQVNPLSILTPGMFRDLFRAPPPTLATTPDTSPQPVPETN